MILIGTKQQNPMKQKPKLGINVRPHRIELNAEVTYVREVSRSPNYLPKPN